MARSKKLLAISSATDTGKYKLDQNILTRIWLERLRQKQLVREGRIIFDCASPVVDHNRKLRVLAEEAGEVARAIDKLEILDCAARRIQLREEITQVAAVAVAWLESFETI